MVKKISRIAPKPTSPPPAADEWVKQGGVDPEIEPAAQKPPETPTEPEQKGKPFPHRISFDVDTSLYKRLKRAAFESDRSLNEILREAAENWLKEQ